MNPGCAGLTRRAVPGSQRHARRRPGPREQAACAQLERRSAPRLAQLASNHWGRSPVASGVSLDSVDELEHVGASSSASAGRVPDAAGSSALIHPQPIGGAPGTAHGHEPRQHEVQTPAGLPPAQPFTGLRLPTHEQRPTGPPAGHELETAPEPLSLFDSTHVTQLTLRLLVYLPLGCVLGVLRSALWVAGIAADQPWFQNRAVVDAYLWLLGFQVIWRGERNIPPPGERHVLVSNHVSVGDLMVLFQRPQRYCHLITPSLPARVTQSRHLPVLMRSANKRTYEVLAGGGSSADNAAPSSGSSLESAEEEGTDAGQAAGRREQTAPAGGIQDPLAAQAPVHLFPEGGMTNGRGMMKFSRGFMRFAEGLPVVPVALRVRTALPEVCCHTLDSPFLANLFWFSFPPWTRVEAVALPAMTLAPGESKAAFVARVQAEIARELGVGISDLNVQQKRQLAQPAQRQQRH